MTLMKILKENTNGLKPANLAARILEEMNAVFADYTEFDHSYEVNLDVMALTANNVSLQCENNRLTIRFSNGKAANIVHFPEAVAAGRIKAVMADSTHCITIPKR